MSHISKFAQKVTDIRFFCSVAEKRGHQVRIAETTDGIEVHQFSRNIVRGASAEVLFKGWRYPCAIMPNGEVLYDHWGSAVNTMEEMGLTIQEYNRSMIMNNIDYTQVETAVCNESKNGDLVVTLEY